MSKVVMNAAFWREKLDRNVARDRGDDAALIKAGWAVVRVWEHERVDAAASRIECEVRARRQANGLEEAARI